MQFFPPYLNVSKIGMHPTITAGQVVVMTLTWLRTLITACRTSAVERKKIPKSVASIPKNALDVASSLVGTEGSSVWKGMGVDLSEKFSII